MMHPEQIAAATSLIESTSGAERLRAMCSVVKRVILENFNYCNRTCYFCSNATLDRRTSRKYLPAHVYLACLRELADGAYSNCVAFGRYSEPLADEITIERLRIARANLPQAHLLINSNGDYLTRSLLAELQEAGIDELKVMRYPPSGEAFSLEVADKACQRLLRDLGLTARRRTIVAQELVYYEVALPNGAILSVRGESYEKRGCDRGGTVPLLSGPTRLAPCYAPYFEINIDFDGSVMPCCNLRSDEPSHRSYVLGNIERSTLVDVFFAHESSRFRASVSRPAPTPQPCLRCTYFWP